MIAISEAASIFRGTRGSRSIEISAPGAFTAVGFSGQQKNPGASAAERGRPSLFKTIDEDRRERHDHINRSGRSIYPGRISVLISGATPIHVEYGHFEEYVDWLNSTWKPTMDAMKKAGLIIDYKVFRATPKTPDQPNTYLWITYKNMAALDKGVELEDVAKKVICSTECQNKARVARSEYRKVLGTEYIREVILK